MTSINGTQERLKYAVLIGDGMADVPIPELGDRTPLEYARTPNMDLIASRGLSGMVRTIPAGMPPGSDVATLSILGYDPGKYFTGRAPLEAAQLGIHLSEEETAFRCNLITVDEKNIVDYAAGHIGTEEARVLISFLNERLGTDSVRFYPGVSYRHICVIRGVSHNDFECTPPHDVTGKPMDEHLPQGKVAGLIRELMRKSIPLLGQHEVNISRTERGLKPANMIWLWGQGITPRMPGFRERFGLDGGVISAVDLVQGLAKLIGLECIEVPGATGYYDTNYRGKGEYASNFLSDHDFVLVHVEAADEASHNADLEQKIAAIQNFDELVVGPIYRGLSRLPRFRIMILPDHATPIYLRTHTADPVPFVCHGEGIPGGDVRSFSERDAERSGLKFIHGHKLMEAFIREEKW
jgi:2,3-bisphosphoglycerate-independent phosphoglycerate mutase